MDGLVCPKCNHIRRRQYDRHGNKHGWFCAECQRIKRRNAKLDILPPKKNFSICRKCGYKRIQKYVSGKRKGWICKRCDQEYRRLPSTGDRTRKYWRNYRLKNMEKSRQTVKDWQEKNHTKTAAHSLGYRAIRDGRLVKKPCDICGDINVDAHHDDYSQPLNIRWLCKKHHGQQHAVNFKD